MGMGLSGGYAAGASTDALKDLIKQKFMEQIENRRAQEAQQQFGQNQQRIDLTASGQEQEQGRFNTQRGDQQEAVRVRGAAEQAAKAEQAQAVAAFLQSNPHMQGVMQAQGAGLNISDPTKLESPEQQAQRAEAAAAAGLRQKQAENDITVGGQLRVQGAGHQNAVRLARMGQDAKAAQAGAKPGVGTEYINERQTRIRQSVDELDKKVSGWTTGGGSLLANLPSTDARNFAAELNSLKGNIAFGELSEMRAASKTGGALGAVSERELALLESTLGALDPGQSPANFRAQLAKIRSSLDRWNSAKNAGAEPGGAGRPPMRVVGDTGAAPGGGGSGGGEFDFVPGKGLVPRK